MHEAKRERFVARDHVFDQHRPNKERPQTCGPQENALLQLHEPTVALMRSLHVSQQKI